MNIINDLFDNLDDWRHLPAYQLERRADVFFSLYLPAILEAKFGEEITGIIPEFPIKIGTIHTDSNSNRSFKIDYFAKVKGKNKAYYIELKTDDLSRRTKQDRYLERTQEVGLTNVLIGLGEIYKATKSKGKYKHLLEKLQLLGLLTITEDGTIQVPQAEYSTEIIYLQPNNRDERENVISFEDAAKIMEKENDGISKRFAQSLREWVRVKAGEL